MSIRVLFTSPPMGPSYGGPYNSVRLTARAVRQQGVDCRVMMPFGAEAARFRESWEPVPLTIEGKVCFSPLCWSPRFGHALGNADVDILHTQGIWQHPSWGALGWKRRWHRPHVVSPRGMLEPWAWKYKAWKKRPIWKFFEERNLQSASLLHATALQEAQALRSLGLQAPIAVIPNGVESPEVPKDWLAALSRAGSVPKVALFLGRIHPKKGLPLLLKTWASLRPDNWWLSIVGPDEVGHLAEVRRLVSDLRLDSVVKISGPLTGEAKATAFREADLFVLPSYSENFGISIAEALSYGVPVITTHGTPWEGLEANRCGWWVPASTEGLEQALAKATSASVNQLSEIGRRGRAWVARDFCWSSVADKLVECYRWLLEDSRRPDCVVDF